MNRATESFSEELRHFVKKEKWTFAKTMPKWPHEYIVRGRVDEALFERLVLHIREHGCRGPFYDRSFIYYEEAGLLYWTMGEPLKETIIVNRCKKENSYENRLKNGILPE